MKLIQYPQAIAETERQLLKATQALRAAQAELDQLNAAIDSEIANNSELKNDAQRKAKRSDLMSEQLYQECLKEWQYQADNRTAVEIELNLLRNQFTVQKLLLRESIALRELQAESAA